MPVERAALEEVCLIRVHNSASNDVSYRPSGFESWIELKQGFLATGSLRIAPNQLSRGSPYPEYSGSFRIWLAWSEMIICYVIVIAERTWSGPLTLDRFHVGRDVFVAVAVPVHTLPRKTSASTENASASRLAVSGGGSGSLRLRTPAAGSRSIHGCDGAAGSFAAANAETN